MILSDSSITSVEFSPDSSLIAAGSAESCVRLWSLNDEKLKAKSLDPATGEVVEDEGLAMRKLVGHSGPVYSLSFDPIAGSGGPPHSMLTSSQDGTVRLWSMDTYSNLAVYRGHGREPVWDVEWGPLGVYFATGSRDRTARLWSSDRITPLRMYTGHLSDVNVSLPLRFDLTPVRQVPPQLALPRNRLQRQLLSTVGRAKRGMSPPLPWPQRCSDDHGHLSRRSNTGFSRSRLQHLPLGPGLRPANQEDAGPHRAD